MLLYLDSYYFKHMCVFGYTLQEVWSCWMELLQYLDLEQHWLNTLEEKVKATDNLPESSEAVSEALEVKLHTGTHTSLLQPCIINLSYTLRSCPASLLLMLILLILRFIFLYHTLFRSQIYMPSQTSAANIYIIFNIFSHISSHKILSTCVVLNSIASTSLRAKMHNAKNMHIEQCFF